MWARLKKLAARIQAISTKTSVFTDDEQITFRRLDALGKSLAEVTFAWKDIDEIQAFKRDLGTIDTICFALQVSGDWYELCEEDDDFWPLTRTVQERYPSITADWYPKVMQPTFATCKLTLWTRE